MKEIESDFARVWIEGDLMLAYYKVDTIDGDSAKKMIADRLILCEGKTYPCLVDATAVKSISKEAREAFASGDGVKNMTACALVVGSPVNRLLGNFFLSVSKPKVPTRLFTTAGEAKKWLDEFLKE